MKKAKAIALFSGGLDSILATILMLEQGIEIHALTFITPFSGFINSGRDIPARVFARKLNIPITVKFLGNEFVELVKQPSHGYGKHLNPCIDCRIMLLQKAMKVMERMKADFIIAGEVVGERPMTQHKKAMRLIEKEAGVEGLLVRPLSAKLLEPTIPEQQGIIRREQLLAIEGRSRKPQMALAKKYGIEDYPTPAGGCLLTDPVFSIKLNDALKHGEDTLRDMAILSIGRHFRLPSGAKLIVGRNEKENMKLLAAQTEDTLCFDTHEIPSPIAILRKIMVEADIAQSASICFRYSDSALEDGDIDYWKLGEEKKSIAIRKIKNAELDELRIKG